MNLPGLNNSDSHGKGFAFSHSYHSMKIVHNCIKSEIFDFYIAELEGF